MRTKVLSVAGIVALTGALVASAGAAKTKTFHFTTKVTGAQISATQSIFKVHDSRAGNGAGVQTVHLNNTGTGGTDKETIYYGNASATSAGSFTLGTPDANGISKLTGTGHDTGGTGRLKGFKSTYTYSGTFNTKSLIFNVTIKGKGSTK